MSRRKRYSSEFKREALRRANEEGVTDVLVAEELGMTQNAIRKARFRVLKRLREELADFFEDENP